MSMSAVTAFTRAFFGPLLAFLKRRSKKQFFVTILVLGLSWYGYGYFFGSEETETRYVLGTVEKRTIVSSVSASGQISSSNQLDVKSKASGEILSLRVEPGDTVRAGQVIAVLDSTDAQKSVRDALANLESAKISLAKIQKPASALTLTQAENSLTNAEDSLAKTYTDSRTHVTNIFLDLPSAVTGLESILIGTDIFTSQWNMDYYKSSVESYDNRIGGFRDVAYSDFLAAKKSYDVAFAKYQTFPISPSNTEIEEMLAIAYTAVESAQKATRSANALITLYQDIIKSKNQTPINASNTALTNLNSYTGKLNSHFSNLVSDGNALKQYKQTIAERKQNIEDIKSGADELDIQSARLSIIKAENALLDARNNLADYTIVAPFDGTVSSVPVKKRETVGGSSVIATIVSPEQIAELSLNEVDAAKIKVGDKTTLTFDAIEELSLTGKVAHVDPVGEVNQGVVSYTIQIHFDTQDERVKPGMTVNAAIITAIRPDVLSVSAGAIKNQAGRITVQAFNPPYVAEKKEDDSTENTTTSVSEGIVTEQTPESITVTIGISDDTYTEILSGLTEGQQIIERTITQKATTATTSAPSLFGGPPGGNRAGQTNTRTGGTQNR